MFTMIWYHRESITLSLPSVLSIIFLIRKRKIVPFWRMKGIGGLKWAIIEISCYCANP